MKNNGKTLRNIGIGAGVVVALSAATLATSITTVKSGEVGVKVHFGKALDNPLSEGVHFHAPIIENIVKMDLKVQKAEVLASSSSKDLQEVDMTLAVNYRIDYDNSVKLYKNVGMSYEEVILQPAIQECIKSVTSRYTAEQLITRRSEVSNECMEELSKKLGRYGIAVDDINITNFSFSEAFDTAIEEKQVAEQKVLTAQQKLKEAEVKAQEEVARAKAQKEANDLIAESYTPEILFEHFLEKWNGELPNFVSYGTETGITHMIQ